MALNKAPDPETFIAEVPTITTKPAIHVYGGTILESQIDPTKGIPGTCGLNLNLVGQLAAALSPLQPLLTAMDAVSHLAQCMMLLVEVQSDPFKIPDLIGCIPGLIGKINALLALIPPFPQGIVQIATMVVDIVRFAGNMIGCIVEQFESIRQQLAELARLDEKIAACEDDQMLAGLKLYRDESQSNVSSQIAGSMAALGPIARILCLARTMLAMTGEDGKKIAEKMSFPNPGDVDGLDTAITVLKLTRDIILGAVTLVEAIALPFGGLLPAPDLAFKCPLDVPSSSTDEVVPEPMIAESIPASVAAGSGDTTIVVYGINFDAKYSQIYWNTAKLEIISVEALKPPENIEGRTHKITATLRASVIHNSGDFFLMVSNAPATSSKAFSGLLSPEGIFSSPPAVKNSNQLTFTVT